MSFWIWLIIAVLLGIFEATNLSFYLLFVALGAVGAAIAALLGANLGVELITLSVVAVLGVLVARKPLVAKLESGQGRHQLLSGAQGLVGQEAIVVEEVNGSLNPGIVRARGEEWPAISYDDTPHVPGEAVLIVELDRTRLVVTFH
jgi:membrane protein implicated in regulation of membrane protease activity